MPVYAKGHVRAPNKDHLQALSHRRHRGRLQSLKVETPPPAWDSRTLGWVGPVKDQGGCGSCWDFSGTGVVEVAYNKAGVGGGSDNFVLSEQYTLSCGRNGGCNGDDNVTVLDWAKKTGLPLTKDYGSYSANAGRCGFKQSTILYKIDDWGFADSNGGQGITPAADIKLAIMKYGCVGIAIAADDAFMNIRPGSVFHGSGSRNIDHDVILIGWDDSKGTSGKTAWLLRNSWGGDWADGGYCFTGDTKVSLLNGKERTFKELADGLEGDSFWVYSCDESGKIVPGLAHSAKRTRIGAKLVEVELDNGEKVRCTPDHCFMLRDGSYMEASKLQAGDSLMPLYRTVGTKTMKGYEKLYVPSIRRYRYTHREIAGFLYGRYKGLVHHADFNKLNNSPDNLDIMSSEEHSSLHAKLSKHLVKYNVSDKGRKNSSENIKKIWSDPERRKRMVQIMTDANRRNGRKRRGKPNSEAHKAAVGAALRKLYATDVDAYQRAVARIGLAVTAAVKQRQKGLKGAQLEAVRRNGKKGREAALLRLRENGLTDKQKAACLVSIEKARSIKVENFHIRGGLTEAQLSAVRRNVLVMNEKRKQKGTSEAQSAAARRNLEKAREAKVMQLNHKVVSVRPVGFEDVYDLTVDGFHNFALSAGVFVHNCYILEGVNEVGTEAVWAHINAVNPPIDWSV